MRWLDVSEPTRVTDAWCVARVAEEPTGLCVDAWTGNRSPAFVERALRRAREAGMPTAIYYVPHAFSTPTFHWEHVREACGSELAHLVFVAIDVEDIGSGDPMPDQWKEDHLRQSVDLVKAAGLHPIIYSNRAAWNPAQLSDAFSDLPLWVADYNGDPAIDLRFPFGGWTQPVGKQYRGTTALEGVTVDFNSFDDAWLNEAGASAGVAPIAVPPRPGEAELNRIWAALDAAEHALTDPALVQQMEDAKQQGVVPLKALLGLSENGS